MAENTGSKVSYFLVGLGIGALIGILFAPKSGEETREYLAQKADEGKEYAQKKARELRERAEDLVDRGKQVAVRQKESFSAAVDAGREAYQREKSKAQ
jgi:gas vesicle protein